MDADRFDAWTRAWVSTPSRRIVLRLLAGGLGGPLASAATALIGLAPGPAEAKNKKNKNNKTKKQKKKCTGDKVKCGKACISKHDCCVGGKRLQHGARYRDCGVCTSGKLAFGDTSCNERDPDGCQLCQADFTCQPISDGIFCQLGGAGSCGVCEGGLCNAAKGRPCGTSPGSEPCCSAGKECCQQLCRKPCPAGEFRDPNSCTCCEAGQTCETAGGKVCCPPDQFCFANACCEACGAPRKCCQVEGDGYTCCRDTCHPPCPAGTVRDRVTCQCACAGGCPGGQTCCNNQCVDTQANNANCGASCLACDVGQQCVDGFCRSERCPAPMWYVCGDTCCLPSYGKCCSRNGVDFCCARVEGCGPYDPQDCH